MLRLASLLLSFIFIASCTLYGQYQLDKKFGDAHPVDREQVALGQYAYWDDVKPIIDNRCVVCHGCYDAPCQLKMSAFEGIDRGSSSEKVYDGGRLLAASLTRLFDDGNNTKEWREKSFYPVLNERSQNSEANKESGVMYKMLKLKKENSFPSDNQILPDNFDFSLDPEHSCPKIEEFKSFAKQHPQRGMPYGLPGLSDREYQVITSWIEDGAPYRDKQWVSEADQLQITKWESFFNNNNLKHQITSRYLYEHLFHSHLYFKQDDANQFYRLVRSATPAPQQVEQIVTRRPYDDPQIDRVFYRLIPVKTSILNKTHMPYLLDNSRMSKWKDWFIDPEYEVNNLPSYEPAVASNPFVAFNAIPQKARYQFLLDEAQHTIMGYIKGPVCRGQIALSVIDDHFWIVFIDPNNSFINESQEFIFEHSDLLRLPAEKESNALALRNWSLFSGLQNKYLAEKTQYIENSTNKLPPLSLDYIWDGDGRNQNYALTVFRHFSSATVTKGLVGQTPKTAWLIGYPLLERIHYLLVAGFDVYGNVGHQFNTRAYMDFLRMEGEFNFLAFMPKDKREDIRDFWYRKASKKTKEYIYGSKQHFDKDTGIKFKTDSLIDEFFGMLKASSTDNSNQYYDLGHANIPDSLRQTMDKLNQLKGKPYNILPDLTFIQVNDQSHKYFFTLIKSDGRYNITHMFEDSEMLAPEETYLTLVPNQLGAYPNNFFKFDITQAEDFVTGITTLSSEADYQVLNTQFAIRRSSPEFWKFSDQLHEDNIKKFGVESGLFDLNHLENR